MLTTMALPRAIHRGKRAQLAITALVAGSVACFIALLWETEVGTLGDEATMILTVASSVAQVAAPVLLPLRVETDYLVTYVIAALSDTGGGFYIISCSMLRSVG